MDDVYYTIFHGKYHFSFWETLNKCRKCAAQPVKGVTIMYYDDITVRVARSSEGKIAKRQIKSCQTRRKVAKPEI